MMARYGQDLVGEINQLRSQGLTDNLIVNELTRRGYSAEQVQETISQADSMDMPNPPGIGGMSYGEKPAAASSEGMDSNIYERIEEIAESMIDEKWDDLIAEVKKIVEWKDKIEEKQSKLINDVQKLKEDFSVLHQGVLGKLEDYDNRMQEVGTELKAVGKVFKDVIPEFVENVKELDSITKGMKKK